MWGDYLENIFVKDRQLHLGVSAITCYLHACRHQNESKSRKYLAKVNMKVHRENMFCESNAYNVKNKQYQVLKFCSEMSMSAANPCFFKLFDVYSSVS